LLNTKEEILSSNNKEILNYKQLVLDNEQKFSSLKDLLRINQENYGEVVVKNLELNTLLRESENSKSKWRAYGITATIVGVVAALISIN